MVLSERPDLNAPIVAAGSSVTLDLREDRVRTIADDNGLVSVKPIFG